MAKQYPGYMSFQGKLEEPIEDKALQILKLQALGCSNEVIAEELHISVSTVKYHCRENYRKLGVNGKAAAIAEKAAAYIKDKRNSDRKMCKGERE